MSLILFGTLARVSPTPPELLKAAFTILQDPGSTQVTVDTNGILPNAKEPPLGPQMFWILLPADATFYRDPVTNITEGQSSPEVQNVLMTFLRRPDQTAESLSECGRALSLAQVRNSAVNAELLRWLDSADPVVQTVVLENTRSLTLTPADFAAAHSRVTHLAEDAATPIEVRKLAKNLLSCWTNERHQSCPTSGLQ